MPTKSLCSDAAASAAAAFANAAAADAAEDDGVEALSATPVEGLALASIPWALAVPTASRRSANFTCRAVVDYGCSGRII